MDVMELQNLFPELDCRHYDGHSKRSGWRIDIKKPNVTLTDGAYVE
jgi:hypothetical protein